MTIEEAQEQIADLNRRLITARKQADAYLAVEAERNALLDQIAALRMLHPELPALQSPEKAKLMAKKASLAAAAAEIQAKIDALP